MLTIAIFLIMLINITGAIIIAAYYQYNPQMLVLLQGFTAVALLIVNKIDPQEVARKMPVWVCFILPGAGPLIFGAGYIIEHVMIRKTSLIKDYEQYIEYINEHIAQELPDIHKEVNVMSVYDSIKYSENTVKKQVITELIIGEAEYRVDVLKKALGDNDPEVVHYAAAALNHIEQNFEETLYTLGYQYQRDRRYEVLKELILVFKQYIQSGLLEGKLLKMHLRDYVDFLYQTLSFKEEFDTYHELLKMLLELEEYEKAMEMTRNMYQKFPERHESHLALMRSLYHMRNYQEVTHIARKILQLDVPLTDVEREMVLFWA